MADESVNLTPDEQKFFDSKGGEAPAEQPKEQANEKPVEPVAEKPVKVAKGKPKAEAAAEPESEGQVETPAPKDPKDEQIENINKALRESREEIKREREVTNARLQQLQQALVKPVAQAEPEEMPDPDKDAMGALKFLLKEQQKVKEFQGQTQAERERATAVHGVMNEAGRQETEFLKTQPDFDAATGTSPTYNEASAFLLNMRRAELQALGFDPQRIMQTVKQEAIGLAAQALQNHQNPAEIVLNLAKARGFAAKPKAPLETEQQKLDRISKGQEQGFSIGQAAGSKAPNNSAMDAKTLAKMSDDDFTAFLNKAKKSTLREMMGD